MNLQDELSDFCKFRCEYKNNELEVYTECPHCDDIWYEEINYCKHCKVKEFIEQL